MPKGAAPGAAVITHLYESLPAGAPVPWHAWLPYFAAWIPFVLCLYLVMICMAVLLRKQWVENEHLTYPLNYLPLALAGANSRGRPVILRQSTFWIGFLISFAINSLVVLHNYFPSVPHWRPWAWIPIRSLSTGVALIYVSLPLLGFFYLVNLDVTFSLAFFSILQQLVNAILNSVGIVSSETVLMSRARDTIFHYLSTGAFLALVVSGLWVARGHLRNVWANVTERGAASDDSGEVLSYRAAFWIMVASLGAMGWWLAASGVPLVALPLLLIIVFVGFVGVTRIVAESGVAQVEAVSSGAAIAAGWLGWGPIGAKGMVALGLSSVWGLDYRTFAMCQVAHTLQMSQLIGHKRQRLMWAFGIAILVALASSIWRTTTCAYRIGGLNMNPSHMSNTATILWKSVSDWIGRRPGPSITGLVLSALGAGIYLILMMMRFRFVGWPFHPLGFCLSGVWIMDRIWFTCLLGWIIKGSVLRYGGLKTYQRLRPAFLGLICGTFICAAVWLIIDYLTGHTGNMILIAV